VKLKTSELQGETLDLVVAHCVEWSKKFPIFTDGKPMSKGNYTTDWALAGPIIEREKLCYGHALRVTGRHCVSDEDGYAMDMSWPNPAYSGNALLRGIKTRR
jgi:hypothetical protein